MQKRERAKERTRSEERTDEPEVIFVERQFPIVLRWPLIWGMIIILVSMIPWSIATANVLDWQPLSVKWMIFGGFVLLAYWTYHFVGWYFTIFVLTEAEVTVIEQKGFFNRTVNNLALNNIQSVNYTIPGMQAALFKFGDISVQTLSGGGHLEIKTLHKPARLQAEILEAVEAYGSTGDRKIVYDSQEVEGE